MDRKRAVHVTRMGLAVSLPLVAVLVFLGLMVSSTAAVGIAIVVASATSAALGFAAVVHWAPKLRNEEYNEIGSVYFNMVGLLYAILLAFVVVVAWEQFSAASATTETEVTRLSNLRRDAGAFAVPERDKVREALRTYTQSVVDDEYPTMARGEPAPSTSEKYEKLWQTYYDLPSMQGKAADFLSESITRLNDLGEARRLRLLASRSKVPTPMWLLLIGGGAFTIGWLYLFYAKSARRQMVLIAAVGGFSGFVLFLVYALQHPFSGDVAITPEVYLDLLSGWR